MIISNFIDKIAARVVFASILLIMLNLVAGDSFAISYNSREVKRECNSGYTICVISERVETEIIVSVENSDNRTQTVDFDIWKNNMKFIKAESLESLENIVLKPKTKVKLGKLGVIDRTKSYGYNFSYTSYQGIKNAIHNDEHIYDLPFGPTEGYVVMQSYGDQFTHKGEENFYAYDFKMPIGVSVHAMRGGLVAEVVQNFNKGGLSRKLRDKSNFITIEHDDGTYSVYSHLKLKGSLVKAGDEVQQGQKIGYSGFTGYGTDPHLHVSVYKVLGGGKHYSLPVKIKTTNGISTKLKTFEKYYKD